MSRYCHVCGTMVEYNGVITKAYTFNSEPCVEPGCGVRGTNCYKCDNCVGKLTTFMIRQIVERLEKIKVNGHCKSVQGAFWETIASLDTLIDELEDE